MTPRDDNDYNSHRRDEMGLMKIKRAGKILVLAMLCCGCHTVNDGWRHTAWSPSTRSIYVKGDYVIIEKSSHEFALIYRAWTPVEVGAFQSVDEAKAMVK